MAFDDPATVRILGFLNEIGIPVEIGPLDDDTFLPGMTVRCGVLHLDPARRFWPGDLLHEAGHIAVAAPAARATLESVEDALGDEMAAMAWSYAAARALGIDACVVFHEGGYHGGGAAYASQFDAGRNVGVPLLEYYQMTAYQHPASEHVALYPHMQRWLR